MLDIKYQKPFILTEEMGKKPYKMSFVAKFSLAFDDYCVRLRYNLAVLQRKLPLKV